MDIVGAIALSAAQTAELLRAYEEDRLQDEWLLMRIRKPGFSPAFFSAASRIWEAAEMPPPSSNLTMTIDDGKAFLHPQLVETLTFHTGRQEEGLREFDRIVSVPNPDVIK